MSEILLSICIPTYNRAKYLEDTILSIVNQKRFHETNDVEIVISDNCSVDATKKVTEKFIGIYGEKIRYYKNHENINDANFGRVLSYGKGKFLKLNNDTLKHQENTLDRIIDAINQNIKEKTIIFFSNGTLKNISKCNCNNLDSFVKTVSYQSTWIACFGIWKEDFDSIDGFNRNANLQLVQTDILLRLIASDRIVMVDNSKIFNSVSPTQKGGYNIYQVFITNYIGLLKVYRRKKQITWGTFFIEKGRLLIHFLIPWTLILLKDPQKYTLDTKRGFSIVIKSYWSHPVLYISGVYLVLQMIKFSLKKHIFH